MRHWNLDTGRRPVLQVAVRVGGVYLLGEAGRVWSGDSAPVFFLAVELWVLLLTLEVSP